MNENTNLVIPYYQSDYWNNLLTDRIRTLKEDSLFLKGYVPQLKTQRGKSYLTNRTMNKEKNKKLQTLNNLKKTANIKDILNDSSLDNISHSNNKSIFRYTSTSFTYCKMKERWNQKIKKSKTNFIPLTYLVFPSKKEMFNTKKKNSEYSSKTQYLLFLINKNKA